MKLNISLLFFILVNRNGCASEVNEDETPSVVKPRIRKCCLIDEYVGGDEMADKTCIKLNTTQIKNDFKDFPIFDKNAESMNKNVFKAFDVVPNEFATREGFKDNVFNAQLLEGNVYLIDSGHVYLERPNKYDRFQKYDEFCVDLYMQTNGTDNFAFWLPQDSMPESTNTNNKIMTGSMLFSCFCLFLVLVVYALLAELRNLCGRILMAYVTCLMFALLLLAVLRIKMLNIDELPLKEIKLCYDLTPIIYYFFLASFCWMTVMCVNWVLEVISFLYPAFQGWFISAMFNILVGLSIFLIFVCKKKIFKKLAKLYARKTQKRPVASSRSNTTASEGS